MEGGGGGREGEGKEEGRGQEAAAAAATSKLSLHSCSPQMRQEADFEISPPTPTSWC